MPEKRARPLELAVPLLGRKCPWKILKVRPIIAAMTLKIPASLNWLARKRKYIAGQMRSAEKQHQKFLSDHEEDVARASRAHAEHLHILQCDLEAIDRALRMHEIPVAPEKIGAVRFQSNPSRSGYGQITRLIYKALARSHPCSLTTTKITACIKTGMQRNSWTGFS